MSEDRIGWQAVERDEGEPIPDLDGFDILISMGGPMDVWQKKKHPWIVSELDAIREWVGDARRRFLGFCLAHRLLAEALGGGVGEGALARLDAEAAANLPGFASLSRTVYRNFMSAVGERAS